MIQSLSQADIPHTIHHSHKH